MQGTIVRNYASPDHGCFNVGETVGTKEAKGVRHVSAEMLAALIESKAAVELDENGAPKRPKPEKATNRKSGETASQEK